MNGRQRTDGNLALDQNNVIVIEAAQKLEVLFLQRMVISGFTE